MGDKTFHTRIKQRRGTATYWASHSTEIPFDGEIIVYTNEGAEPQRVKIGDGQKTIAELPFVTSNEILVEGEGNAITNARYDSENGKIVLEKNLPNSQTLTIGSKTYNGSAPVTVTAADLGLSAAMKFLGNSTTVITDGVTTNPIIIDGTSITVTAGNVVLYNSKEFVWNGNSWEELGNEGSYKIVQDAVSSPSANGSATAFIDTISQDANGKITVTKKNVTFPTLSGGVAVTADASIVGGVTVNGHAVDVSKKTLIAGDNINIVGANDKITISATGGAQQPVANNLTTTEEGYVLDARQGQVLNSLVSQKAITMNYTATFDANNWSSTDPYTQSIIINGILITDTPFIDINLSSVTTTEQGKKLTDAWMKVGRITAETNQITAYCYEEKPTINLPITVKVVR